MQMSICLDSVLIDKTATMIAKQLQIQIKWAVEGFLESTDQVKLSDICITKTLFSPKVSLDLELEL